MNVTDNNNDYSNGNSLSFSTSVAFNRPVQRWLLSVDFSYAQNVQTYLITYMNSFYTYSGNVRRVLRWTVYLERDRCGFAERVEQPAHTGNSSQSYSTSLGFADWTAAASYAKSNGLGSWAGTGCQATAGYHPSDWMILYGGDELGDFR